MWIINKYTVGALFLAMLIANAVSGSARVTPEHLVCKHALEFEDTMRVERETLRSGTEVQEDIFSFYVDGNYVGNMAVRVRGNSMSVDNLNVAYKNRGWSHTFYRTVLRNFPGVTSIESMLVHDNYRIAMRERFKSADQMIAEGEDQELERWLKQTLTFEECSRLVAATPAYRVRHRLGFTRITVCWMSLNGIELVMEKPERGETQ